MTEINYYFGLVGFTEHNLSNLSQMVVLFVTLAILSFGAWGVTGMR